MTRLLSHRNCTSTDETSPKMRMSAQAFPCLTADVISEYPFPSGHILLDAPEFDHHLYDAWMALLRISHMLKQFGWLYPVLDSMPLLVHSDDESRNYLVLQQSEELLQRTLAIAARRESADYNEVTGRPSILEAFLASNLPPHEKSHGLKYATYHGLASPSIIDRLMYDLGIAIPNPDSLPILRELEQIHYLVAIMYEILRISYGVSNRLQRVFPNDAVRDKEWVISASTPIISMTSVQFHENETLFPSRSSSAWKDSCRCRRKDSG